jgi:hypothetical protein
VKLKHAYAAGLFDGEGCVMFFQRTSGQWQTELTLSNCDRLALEFLVDLFGGHFRVAAKLVGTRRHPIGIWNISGDSATKAAKAMLPYSILKKEQLTLFLEGRATVKGRGRPLLAPVVKQRKKIAQRIRFLKRPQWQGAGS